MRGASRIKIIFFINSPIVKPPFRFDGLCRINKLFITNNTSIRILLLQLRYGYWKMNGVAGQLGLKRFRRVAMSAPAKQ